MPAAASIELLEERIAAALQTMAELQSRNTSLRAQQEELSGAVRAESQRLEERSAEVERLRTALNESGAQLRELQSRENRLEESLGRILVRLNDEDGRGAQLRSIAAGDASAPARAESVASAGPESAPGTANADAILLEWSADGGMHMRGLDAAEAAGLDFGGADAEIQIELPGADGT